MCAAATSACAALGGIEDLQFTSGAATDGAISADGPGSGDSATVVDSGTSDSGLDADTPTDAADAGCLSCARHVFVTSLTYTGTMGGLSGAIALCKERADSPSSKLKGLEWDVWLSTTTSAAGARLAHGTGPYVRTDGSVIAANWTEFTNGLRATPINQTEEKNTEGGSLNLGGLLVWTASTPAGALSGGTCMDWSDQSAGVAVSQVLTNIDGGSRWSDQQAQACSNLGALYCIEKR
jgi:hypothetical protein